MKAFIVGDNDSIMVSVREVLVRHGFDCPVSNALSFLLATDLLSTSKPDVTVLVMSQEPDVDLSILGQVRRGEWGYVIVVGPTSDAQLILKAMRMGADEYADIASCENDLRDALLRHNDNQIDSDTHGKIIACIPACGGCGASTLAVNVATTLAKHHETSALLDFRLASGDLASLLDLEPEHTLSDLSENLFNLDHEMFERMLAKHSSGVHLLASPNNFSEIAEVTPSALREALSMARSMFPYVIADFEHPAIASV